MPAGADRWQSHRPHPGAQERNAQRYVVVDASVLLRAPCPASRSHLDARSSHVHGEPHRSGCPARRPLDVATSPHRRIACGVKPHRPASTCQMWRTRHIHSRPFFFGASGRADKLSHPGFNNSGGAGQRLQQPAAGTRKTGAGNASRTGSPRRQTPHECQHQRNSQ